MKFNQYEHNYSWAFQSDKTENWAYWDNLFTEKECEELVAHGKKIGLNRAYVGIDTIIDDSTIRDSNVAFINPAGIEWAYRKLTDAVTTLNDKFFNFDIWGFHEGLQFTEYNAPGGHYKAHIDKSYNGAIRKLSVVVQLTDENEYEGGDLEILINGEHDPIKMKRSIGHLVIFPSYLLHRVLPVTKGTRHSLVGWVSGKPFR